MFTAPGREWLSGLGLPAEQRIVVDDCLQMIDALGGLIGRLDGQVSARVKPDPRAKLLTSLPGVGMLTALTILSEIGDVTRFDSARKLASWAGLTPTVRNSDRTVRHGHISKQGSPWVRWVLGEAAQTAKRHADFAGAYQAMVRRRGRNIATVAVARKLLTRCWHLLADYETQQRGTQHHSPSADADPANESSRRTDHGTVTKTG